MDEDINTLPEVRGAGSINLDLKVNGVSKKKATFKKEVASPEANMMKLIEETDSVSAHFTNESSRD